MTLEEVEYLQSAEAVRWIERYLTADPLKAALSGVPAVICTQIKYLQRCRKKLPVFYEKRCIVPPLAFEQSSGWAAAGAKSYAGKRCVDMTCGLGADALHFSRSFDRVIAIEKDPVLCAAARYNFSRLGADNITVLCGDASVLVEQAGPADLVYADPARRKEGRKVFLFEDCSPDIGALMPRLAVLAARVVVKASPLFDADEAFRRFGSYGRITVKAVSSQNECKELLIDIEPEGKREETVGNVLIDRNGHVRYYEFVREKVAVPRIEFSERYGYAGIADVAFYKSRTFLHLMRERFPDGMTTDEAGIALWPECPVGFPGRVFRIKKRFGYKPKETARCLKNAGLNRVVLLKHAFPVPAERIRKELKISEGTEGILLCTEIAGKKMVLEVEDI